MADKPQEETIKDRITGLLEKGYTRGQLINDFGFAERTVGNAIKQYKESHSDEADEINRGNDLDVKALTLPVKLDIKQIIDQKIPKGEPSGGNTMTDRMLGPMADMAGKQLANMSGRMFGMSVPGQSEQEQALQFQAPFGWEYKSEGGHLMVRKKDKVTGRSDMTYQEAMDFMQISMAIGKAMYEVLGIETMNYEDLGNWGIDNPGGAKMHLRFFGRAHEQIHQIRGHHMFIYPRGHKIFDGHLQAFSDEDVKKLRAKIEDTLREAKYLKMAELAGV